MQTNLSQSLIIKIGVRNDEAWDRARPWKVTIRPMIYRGQAVSEIIDRKSLVLTNKNAQPGMTFRTAALAINPYGHSYCWEVEERDLFGEPPPIHIVRKLETHRRDSPLSVFGAKFGDAPNFTPASEVWQNCKPNEDGADQCNKKYATPTGDEGDETVSPIWTEEGLQRSLAEKQQRLARAFSPIIWLGEEYFDLNEQTGEFEACFGARCGTHCSGFFIAPRIVMTNAHCVVPPKYVPNLETQRYELVFRIRNALRGWLRPVAGDTIGGGYTPQLQHLTPIFVGRPGSGSDYALLYVEDSNITERLTERTASCGALNWQASETEIAQLPCPASLAEDNDWPTESKEQLTIIGYPKTRELVMSFDTFCNDQNDAAEYESINNLDETFGLPFRHRCDTEGGSSGSPVFDRDLTSVRALHYGATPGFVTRKDDPEYLPACWPKNEAEENTCYNFGVFFDVIAWDIEQKLKSAGLYDLVADCDTELSDDVIEPLSTEGLEMPNLDGAVPLTKRKVIEAFRSLPPRLLPAELRAAKGDAPTICAG